MKRVNLLEPTFLASRHECFQPHEQHLCRPVFLHTELKSITRFGLDILLRNPDQSKEDRSDHGGSLSDQVDCHQTYYQTTLTFQTLQQT